MTGPGAVSAQPMVPEGPFVLQAKDMPDWVGTLVEAIPNEDDPAPIRNYRALRGRSGPEFVVVNRRNDGDYDYRLDLYRIVKGKGEARALRRVPLVAAPMLEVARPIGYDLFGDGMPAIVIEYSFGGNIGNNTGSRLYRTSGTVRDVTPRGYGILREVMRGDQRRGRHVLVFYDDRWNWFFGGGCGACDVYVPTVVEWTGTRYVPACRSHRAVYREWIGYADANGLHRASYRAGAGPDIWAFLDYHAVKVLLMAQSGEVRSALRLATTALAEARRRGRLWREVEREPWGEVSELTESEFETRLAEFTKEIIAPLREAMRYVHAPCPLSRVRSMGAPDDGLEGRDQ